MKSKKKKITEKPLTKLEKFSLSAATKILNLSLKGKEDPKKRELLNVLVERYLPGFHIHGAPLRKKPDTKKKVKTEEQSAV